jgi:hypothetical protein
VPLVQFNALAGPFLQLAGLRGWVTSCGGFIEQSNPTGADRLELADVARSSTDQPQGPEPNKECRGPESDDHPPTDAPQHVSDLVIARNIVTRTPLQKDFARRLDFLVPDFRWRSEFLQSDGSHALRLRNSRQLRIYNP